MFNDKHYVPFLKSKDGEFRALAELSDEVKAGLTPLIEIIPEGVKDWKTRERHTLADHLGKVHSRLVKSWTGGRPVFVDFLFDGARELGGDETAAGWVFSALRTDKIHVVPVTKLGASLVYQDEVRKAIAVDKLGFCLRLSEDDFNARTLPSRVNDVLAFYGIDQAQVDVVIDLRDITDAQVAPMALAAQGVIAALPHVERFRTLTLTSSGFPADLGCCTPRDITRLGRADWKLWNQLRRQEGLARVPSYGDFAIAHPELVDFDPTRMRMSAAIRYTTDSEFMVAKGSAIDKVGWEQTRELCKWVVQQPEYKGATFSAGDDYIAKRAAGSVSPGGATTWRRVGTTHHLALTVTQLASLGAP